MIEWQCYLETEMGWQLVTDNYPIKFNRNDVIRAFESRYGCKVTHVNPLTCWK